MLQKEANGRICLGKVWAQPTEDSLREPSEENELKQHQDPPLDIVEEGAERLQEPECAKENPEALSVPPHRDWLQHSCEEGPQSDGVRDKQHKGKAWEEYDHLVKFTI